MRKILAIAASIAASTILLTPHAEAGKPRLSDHVQPKGTYRVYVATHKVKHLRVDFVVREAGGRATVTFNDGQTWSVRPCQVEDSARCFWDAQARGNHKGTSFVRLFAHTFTVQASDYLSGLR